MTPPVVVTPAPSPTPAPSQNTVVVPIDGSKEVPGGNNPQQGAPQPGMPPGVPVGAFAQKPPKEEFDYMPLVRIFEQKCFFLVCVSGAGARYTVGKGTCQTRVEPCALGRNHCGLRRLSHIYVHSTTRPSGF